MDTKNLLNVFDREMQCEYKGRNYIARDNGAILRLPKEGGRLTHYDNIWKFGKKDEKTGYMMFTSNVRVHQVVCTAFHGPAPEDNMVVDHKDTNRCNNRPENLQWVTRLENALNNPITRKKIIMNCGSVEAFLKDPSALRQTAPDPNMEWMRTVTKEEAEKCMKNLIRWAEQDSKTKPSGKGIGNWIYKENVGKSSGTDWKTRDRRSGYLQEEDIEQHGIKDSLTPGAKQLNWKTLSEFPLCPPKGIGQTLNNYLNNLEKGKLFTRTKYGNGGEVYDAGYNPDDDALYVLTENAGSLKPWALCKITIQDDCFIHENQGSFFEEVGGQKYFTLAMGREWTGGDVFDDFC